MPDTDIIVIGGGVAGLSSARSLQRRGRKVTIIDPTPAVGGASFGNAGAISARTVVPIALPGMLAKVPGWLLNPNGPLAVRPSYFPTALPWLCRWILASRMKRVLEISEAMHQLHGKSFEAWRALTGESFDRLFRTSGQIQVWDEESETATAAIERRIRDRYGIESRVLTPAELSGLAPGLDVNLIGRAILIPGNGQSVSPIAATTFLLESLQREGGILLRERVLKLIPDGGRWLVMTNCGNHRAGHVVVAAGAWSKDFLAPLGVSVPLEAERGYHAMLPRPNVQLPVPVMHKSRGFIFSSMEDGLRIAGTVEIAGRDAPPNEDRARILLDHARQLLPGVTSDPPSFWMGCRPSIPDSLPVVGAVPQHAGLYVCFGHGHFGMTAAPPSGELLAQIMLGERPFMDPALLGIARFNG